MEDNAITESFGVVVIPPVYFHPYLKLLYGHLSKLGVNVYSLNLRGMKAFLKIFWKKRRIRLIHFHWIEFYLRSRVFLSTIIKIYRFILQLLFLKFATRLRIVVTLHNVMPHERFFPRIEHVAFALALRLSDSIIVHNHYARKLVQKIYGINADKISVIPHGNFLDYYPDFISSIEARRRLGVPLNKFVLLFFGRIRPYKGVYLLLDAFKRALKRNNKLFLMVVGKPHSIKLARELIKFNRVYSKNSMVRLGFVSDDEVQIFMNAADIGVLPYQKITTTGALLLFMSFGKPVIVSKLPPIMEVVNDDFAIFFDSGDPSSLEEAILRAAMKMNHLSFMGERALEAAKLYDWEKIAYMTFHVYKSLLS